MLLCSSPLQWFIAFESSAMGTCFGISLCQCHNFHGALGPHLSPTGRIQAAGHHLDRPACISSSNKDRNRHEHISPRSENSNKFLNLPITKTGMVKVKAYKFIANSLTTKCLHQISYISMPRATSKGTHAQHGAKITNAKETWNWVFSSQVLQSA